jgi:hypothetical protein
VSGFESRLILNTDLTGQEKSGSSQQLRFFNKIK